MFGLRCTPSRPTQGFSTYSRPSRWHTRRYCKISRIGSPSSNRGLLYVSVMLSSPSRVATPLPQRILVVAMLHRTAVIQPRSVLPLSSWSPFLRAIFLSSVDDRVPGQRIQIQSDPLHLLDTHKVGIRCHTPLSLSRIATPPHQQIPAPSHQLNQSLPTSPQNLQSSVEDGVTSQRISIQRPSLHPLAIQRLVAVMPAESSPGARSRYYEWRTCSHVAERL